MLSIIFNKSINKKYIGCFEYTTKILFPNIINKIYQSSITPTSVHTFIEHIYWKNTTNYVHIYRDIFYINCPKSTYLNNIGFTVFVQNSSYFNKLYMIGS